jgi:hypothetical protein
MTAVPDHTRIRPSDQAVVPADVTDVLLWRLAIDVATAHQHDPDGRCTNLRCADQIGPCTASRQAQHAMRLARRPQPTPPAPPPTSAPTGPGTAVGRAAVPYAANRGQSAGWFTSTAARQPVAASPTSRTGCHAGCPAPRWPPPNAIDRQSTRERPKPLAGIATGSTHIPEATLTFRTEHTLTGYARTAVDLKARMREHCASLAATEYVRAFVADNWAPTPPPDADDEPTPTDEITDEIVKAISRATSTVWAHGEPYVLAPAMTAIVAAAAEALDLTGDLLTADAAPCDGGVLFLPEPIYHRTLAGTVTGIAAITWTPISSASGNRSWLICGWADRDDPDDPHAARIRGYARQDRSLPSRLGPYVLTDVNLLPIATPVPAPDRPDVDEPDRDWETAPDGRYVISDATVRTHVCAAIAYAFWRIQAQPIAVAAPAPLDRAARRRAQRASIVHDTRVVMLRRTNPIAERGDGQAKWHYRVRFVVRGHWRRLVDKQGQPYRIWINAHIKGPDGAPLLLGEKVAVLAR